MNKKNDTRKQLQNLLDAICNEQFPENSFNVSLRQLEKLLEKKESVSVQQLILLKDQLPALLNAMADLKRVRFLLTLARAVKEEHKDFLFARCGEYSAMQQNAGRTVQPALPKVDPARLKLDGKPVMDTSGDKIVAFLERTGRGVTSLEVAKAINGDGNYACKILAVLTQQGRIRRVPFKIPGRGQPKFRYMAKGVSA